MKKIKATTRGGFPYLPLTEVIKDATTREAVFGNGHIWRELLWIKLHEYISRERHNSNMNNFLEQILLAYGDAPYKEATSFLTSLEGNGILTISSDSIMRTQYGDWIIDKHIRRIESCIKAAQQKWKVNPKARPRKNKTEVVKTQDVNTDFDTEILELKSIIKNPPVKKRKEIGLEKAQEFYRANIKDEVLCEALCEHLEVRQAKRVPNTIGALTRLVKRLNDLSLYDPMVATAIVDKSIRSGWADVFELKEVKQKTSYNDIYEQLKHKYSVNN